MESGQLYRDPCTCAESASNEAAVRRLAKSARKTLSSLHTHSAPSPDGMGVRLSHFGPPKLNSFKGLLNLSTSSPTTDPRPPTRRGDRGCAATIKFNRATSPRHPVPSRRKLYIGLRSYYGARLWALQEMHPMQLLR